MDDNLMVSLIFGVACASMSAFFFYQHVTVEGPQQARAKYKTGSMSLAFGTLFGVFALGMAAFAVGHMVSQ